jgi:hypothetical protein
LTTFEEQTQRDMKRSEKQIIEISIDIIYKELLNPDLSMIERGKREENIKILKSELSLL